jgi:hypothetical protein
MSWSLDRILRSYPVRKGRFIWRGISDEVPLDKIGYVATIFWILATVGPNILDPTNPPNIGDFTGTIGPGELRVLSAGFALFLHFAVPAIYLGMKRPFYITSTWYPLAWQPEVHKGKNRGYLRMPDNGQVEIMIPVELLDGIDEYCLQFELTDPYELELKDKNEDQDWDRDEKQLSTENVTHTTFIPRYKITEEGPVGSGDNYHLKITDVKYDRDTEVLNLEIRD